MARMAFFDIAKVAADAGFRGDPHAIVVALAQPESNRVPTAANPQDINGGSYGLLQINGAHDPEATGVYPNMVPTQAWIDRMFDPAENLKAAFAVWKQNNGFSPWGAFTSGLHLPSLDAAKVALDGLSRWRGAQAAADRFLAESQRLAAEREIALASLGAANLKISKAREALG